MQDTWIAMIQHLDGFRGGSSLQTWVTAILINKARRRGAAERRTLTVDGDLPTGRWSSVPACPERPEDRLYAGELRAAVRAAPAALPASYRAVVTARDVDGLDPAETCALLGLRPDEQRTLLHRGRRRLRTALTAYLSASEEETPGMAPPRNASTNRA